MTLVTLKLIASLSSISNMQISLDYENLALFAFHFGQITPQIRIGGETD